MDIVGGLSSLHLFDILVAIGLLAAFILGYAQGAIRRLLGLLSVLFALLLASQLRQPLGQFFADSWDTFPRGYSFMVGFGSAFVVLWVVFAIVIQSVYRKTPVFERYPIVDEVFGGLLGLLWALVLLGAAIVILDTYYFASPTDPFRGELTFLRNVYEAYTGSTTATIYRATIIPAFVSVIGALLPSELGDLY